MWRGIRGEGGGTTNRSAGIQNSCRIDHVRSIYTGEQIHMEEQVFCPRGSCASKTGVKCNMYISMISSSRQPTLQSIHLAFFLLPLRYRLYSLVSQVHLLSIYSILQDLHAVNWRLVGTIRVPDSDSHICVSLIPTQKTWEQSVYKKSKCVKLCTFLSFSSIIPVLLITVDVGGSHISKITIWWTPLYITWL